MEETMNNGVEVTTEVSGEEVTQEVTTEKDSRPSKGFMALVVGGVAAVAIGATVAIKRHKKKKALTAVEETSKVCGSEENAKDEEKPDCDHVPEEVSK